MSGAAGFLEFFILEASDYVEQLDGLLLGGGSSGPDAANMQRVARALRGTATMAKLPTFADLAASVERVGRAIQEGAVRWDPALGGALIAAIDDLKILLHSTRSWTAADDQRASARAAELARYAPHPTTGATSSFGGSGTPANPSPFLATEAANIAAGLELLTTRTGDVETAGNVLRRVRALRGVAGVKEVGPLADTLEATEGAAHTLELGEKELSPEARLLLESAAGYLRELSVVLRSGGDVHGGSAARETFVAAHERWTDRETEPERVIPIAHFFYADGAPNVIETSPNPPTSASERFHLELVSLGEHLRQVTAAAARARDVAATTRMRRDLRRVLRSLRAAAESYGEHDIAEFIGTYDQSADRLDVLGLSALNDLASLLTQPGENGERPNARLRESIGNRELASSIGAGLRADAPAPTAPPPASVLDSASAALIESSIAALDRLNSTPFVDPVDIPEETIVPIETLLYRGHAALDRAVEIRDELRRNGPSSDPESLEELFDLLELARGVPA